MKSRNKANRVTADFEGTDALPMKTIFQGNSSKRKLL
jgi:hypothetical protein